MKATKHQILYCLLTLCMFVSIFHISAHAATTAGTDNTTIHYVSFNTRGGNFISTQKIPHMQTASQPANPTKAGHTFDGWYTDNTFKTAFDFSTPITQETKLYANWIPNTYTVSFFTDGGTSIVSQSVKYYETATEPPAPEKENHTFGGWYRDAEFKNKFKFTYVIKGDTTLYAKWNLITYNVSFNTRGGNFISTQKVGYFQTATKPTNPEKAGHTFAGWYTDNTFTTPFVFSTPITQEIKLYANWTVNSYPLTFNTNGGTDIPAQSVVYNTVAVEPPIPKKVGHTFGGWYKDTKFKKTFNFTSKIKAETTLYAKWIPHTFEISFESVDGSYVPPQTVSYGTYAVKPLDPVKTGYTFAGWFSDTELSIPFDFATPITQETKLFGKWTINKYEVSFNSRGGSYVSPQNVTYEETAVIPEVPTKKGYDFKGWYTDNTFTTAYDFSTPITAATRLYAKWTIHTYTIRFSSKGGTYVNALHVPYMQKPVKPENPTKKGYTFAGWYTDETYTTKYTFKYSIHEDVSLYAKWNVATYTVKFNTKGGSSVAAQKVKYRQNAIRPEAPIFNSSTANYVFAGWYTDESFNNEFLFDTAIRKDITLYAKWYKISFNKTKITVNAKSYVYGFKTTVTKGDKVKELISSDSSIVKITKSGKIYAVKKGNAVITVKTEQGSLKQIKITVK